MLVDAHVHIDGFGEEAEAALDEIERHRILTVAVSEGPDTYRLSREIAARSELVIAAFGVHPWSAPRWHGRLHELDRAIEASPMIGEIGLDHRWVEEPDRYEPQRKVFRHFLERAADLDRVINVHTSGAEAECLEMITGYGCRRVIIHWYSGPFDVLDAMVDAGFYFTVGVELLQSATIRQVAKAIPDGQLLTETDNPSGLEWLTGEVGMPHHLLPVVDELARVRGTSSEAVESTVGENMRRLVEGDGRLEAWAAPLAA